MIRLDSLTKRWPGGRVAVDGLSLDLMATEVSMLLGPSGCGKTTTLKMVNRLVQPTAGRVLLDGRDTADVDPVELRRGLGYVIQGVGLFPHLRVGANVATVPRLLGWSSERVRGRVDELLDLVGLEPASFRDRWPVELSGGQRQRVGVARALAADPPVLLMDEPFGALDPENRTRLQDEFLRLQREVAKTVVFVTHDLDEAVRLGDRIAVLGPGGRLEQFGTPAEVLLRPATPFVAGFVGADRGIMALSVTPVTAARLQPDGAVPLSGGEGQDVTPVPLQATLAEALAAILRSARGAVTVVDGERACGVLTLEALHEAGRRAVSGEDRG